MAGRQVGAGGKENTALVLCTLFSGCLLRRLWVTTLPLACRDVLTGPPFGPLPRIHPGWERKKAGRSMHRKGLLPGEKARTWGAMTRDGIPP